MQTSTNTRLLESAHKLLALRNEQEANFSHYLDLFSSLFTEGFYVIDVKTKQLCYATPGGSILSGLSAEEIIGKEYHKMVYPTDLETVEKIYSAILSYCRNIDRERDNIDFFCCTFKM